MNHVKLQKSPRIKNAAGNKRLHEGLKCIKKQRNKKDKFLKIRQERKKEEEEQRMRMILQPACCVGGDIMSDSFHDALIHRISPLSCRKSNSLPSVMQS